MSHYEEPAWVGAWLRAVRRNLKLECVQSTTRHLIYDARDRLTAHIRAHLPYRFEGAGHRIRSLDEAFADGHGACTESAAAFAAAGIARGPRCPVWLCYESASGVPLYAHVRVCLGSNVWCDAYPEASYEVDGCAVLADVRQMLARHGL